MNACTVDAKLAWNDTSAMLKLSPSELSPASTGWLGHHGELEIHIPDAGGLPSEGSLLLANEFLEQQERIEAEAQRWLTRHLRLEEETQLEGVTVLPEADRHNAVLVLSYINMADRYLWIEIGLSRHLSWLKPCYIFLKYH